MQKNIFVLVLSLLFLQAAKAATPDSLVVFLKKSGKKVDNKDSADYYRVILSPDTNVDKDLYRVYDYYPNGKPRSVATSLTGTLNLVLDGNCINFFPNGKRKSSSQYKNGLLIGYITNYYPNGKLYSKVKIDNYYSRYYNGYYNGYPDAPYYGYKVEVIELRDSIDNVLVTNGTGHVIVYDDDFKKVVVEGNIKNNKKEGEWNGPISDTANFTIVYHKDDMKFGISHTKSGKKYTFKKVRVEAVYSDGMDLFYYFIKKNLQYPESAKKHKARGVVTVGFFIEADGTITNVKVIAGVVKSLDDEAIRVVSMSPPWIPAYLYGIPVRSAYSVGVNFYNLLN